VPYSSTSELPSSVRDKYSDRCQRAFMHAFNSVHDSTGDEGKASAAGHAAAQKCEAKDMDAEVLLQQLGIDLKKDAEDLEPIEHEIKFDFFARATDQKSGMVLKAWTEKDEGGEEQHYLKGVASSTIKDRHGDTILPSALIDMERSANDNLTIFLNHDYKVPEDTGGSVVKASIASDATDPETGAPIYDLNFEKIRIDKANPRAVQTFKSIHGGTKLGLSIGARIPEGGAVRNKKTGALLIAHVELLETSVVGIPANPRSWVEYAVKSYKAGPKEEPSTIVETVITNQAPPPEPPKEPAPPAPAPEVSASTAPSQAAPESGPGADGATTPDVAAAAAPETPAPIDVTKASSSELIDALVKAQAALGDTATKLIEATSALAAAEQRASNAEREAAEMAKTARGVVLDAAQIIRRLEKLPVGQRASFKAIKADFEDGLPAGLDGIYTESFLRQLKGEPTT